MNRIVIVGGGASGIAAALAAAQADHSAAITLLEKNPKLGKKLLATGNGRCNLDNEFLSADCYFSSDRHSLATLFETVNCAAPLEWFSSLGLLTRTDEAGRVYPYSNQAADVLNLLLYHINRFSNLTVRTECRFREVVPRKNDFRLLFLNEAGEEETLLADRIIFAMGGTAAPQFGTDGFALTFAQQCGGRIERPYPCLVPLQCKKEQVKGLSGIRVKAAVSLCDGERLLKTEQGEVQFTDYGLSGIAVMQLSGLLSPQQHLKKPLLRLDLFPQWTEEELTQYLEARAIAFAEGSIEQFGTGLLPAKLFFSLWKTLPASYEPYFHTPLSRLPNPLSLWKALTHAAKNWYFSDLSPTEWKNAQTTGGGLALSELVPNSFEWKGCPNLYFVGETVDCAGTCGGYNLHWAFGSGLAAGRHAAKQGALTSSPAPRKKNRR